MEKKQYRLVVIDDDQGDIELIRRYIEEISEWEADIYPVTSPEADSILSVCRDADVVLLDYMLSKNNGLDVFNELNTPKCNIPVVMITGCGSEMIAVEAMKSGISDYIAKNHLSADSLRRAVNYAIKKAEIQRQADQQLKKLKQLAIIDPLSGFYNRRYFFERLNYEFNRSMRYHQPLSVLMIDFDHFKRINDTYGHQMGDSVLSGVAAVIQKNIRNTDIAARYGGEEFCLILTGTDLQGAVIAGEKIRRQIKVELFQAQGGEKINITISAGAAQLRPDDKNIDEFLDRADTALYRAKAAGRNKVMGEE